MLRRAVLALTSLACLAPTATLAKKPLTAERSLDTRWPKKPALSPDGRQVAFEVATSRLDGPSETQIYLMTLGEGRPRAITRTGGHSPVWSPDGRRLAFVREFDKGPALMVFELATSGEPTILASFAPGIGSPQWTADGRFIVFAASVFPDCKDEACNTEKKTAKKDAPVKARVYDDLLYRHWNAWDEGTREHLFAVPVDKPSRPVDLTPGPYAAPTDILNAGRGWTLAGDTVIYAQNRDAERALSTNNDLYAARMFKGRPTKLTDNAAWDGNPVASPSGRYVAYAAFARAGFEADRAVLHVHDRESNTTVARTSAWDRSVSEIAWSPDEATIYVTAYDRGFKALFRMARDAGPVDLAVSGMHVSSVQVGDEDVVFVGSSFSAPPELWRLDRKTNKARALTSLNREFADGLMLGKVESLTVTSNDGTKVHGFVVLPPRFSPKRRYPLVMLIHGGPQGAWNSQWHARWNPQLFAARGFVVAMPNPRGSVGYGQDFVDAVTRDWGGGPYRDVLAYTDTMEAKGYVKPKATCAAGASYGGYMVNWIAGHTDRFSCLISHAGVFNLESMWGETEELWFPEWEMGGTPWAARERYEKWSPHRYIHQAKTPTLVVHGQLDYRVHLSQGQQMHTSLRRNGVPARFLYFPDEGHWVLKPHNFVFWYDQMLGWLDRHL